LSISSLLVAAAVEQILVEAVVPVDFVPAPDFL